MTNFFSTLTKENWGFPYHWIRMVIILGLVIGTFDLNLLYLPWVVAPLFLFAFVEALVQAKGTGGMVKEMQDLLADIHGLFFVLFIFDILGYLFFLIVTVVMGVVLYITQKSR